MHTTSKSSGDVQDRPRITVKKSDQSGNASAKRRSSGILGSQAPNVVKAASSAQGTIDYFDIQGGFQDLFQLIKSGSTTWAESKKTNGDPCFFAQTEPDANNNRKYITISCGLNYPPDQAKKTGATGDGTPGLTGYFEIMLSYGSQNTWNTVSDITIEGLSSILAASELWDLGKALLEKFKSGTDTTISEAMDGETSEEATSAAESGAEAASEGTVEAGEVEMDLMVDADALGPIAEAVVFAACIALFIDHKTYHNLTLVNLPDYDLEWDITYQKHGEPMQEPSSDQSTVSNVIAGGASSAPPGVEEQESYSDGSFKFQNSDTLGFGFYGVEYVMSLVLKNDSGDTQQNLAAYFSIPYSGKNRIYSSFEDVTDEHDAKHYQKAHDEGSNAVNTQDTSNDNFQILQTIDYLQGKHEDEDGKKSYTYNSMLVIKEKSS